MTGHTPISTTNQEFLSTMHTMIDDLDTISSNIDENTYLRLVNSLQRLYNIHNSTIQASSNSSNRENWIERNRTEHIERYNAASRQQILESIRTQPLEILVRHHERVNDISGIPINTDAFNNNNNNTNYNSLNQALFRENARISYTALYTNASDYWNQEMFRENVIAT